MSHVVGPVTMRSHRMGQYIKCKCQCFLLSFICIFSLRSKSWTAYFEPVPILFQMKSQTFSCGRKEVYCIINMCVIGLKGHCRAEKSYSPPPHTHTHILFRAALSSESWGSQCGKAPSELVEMLSPLQQQQGSGHGSKHPTCPKLAAKWPITWAKAEIGLGKIWLLLNSATVKEVTLTLATCHSIPSCQVHGHIVNWSENLFQG